MNLKKLKYYFCSNLDKLKRQNRLGDTTQKPSKQTNGSSSEDDYEDPFIDDGTEDEYKPDDISSEDSETDKSADEESIKRLMKEAKGFTRKKY